MTTDANETNNSMTRIMTDDRTMSTPTPKLVPDMPRARPDLIDYDCPVDYRRFDDAFTVATAGAWAGIARYDHNAPGLLLHVVENTTANGEDGERWVEPCIRDVEISDAKTDEMCAYFAEFYDLNHDAIRPGTLVGVYEDISDPRHATHLSQSLFETYGLLGPDAARTHPNFALILGSDSGEGGA